eukprot:scaffold85898_cov30-Phaeocystis_antarctica.AAC.1
MGVVPSGPGMGIPRMAVFVRIMCSWTSWVSIYRTPDKGQPCFSPEVFGNGGLRVPLTFTLVRAPLYRVRTAFNTSGGRLKACSTSSIKVCCSRSKASLHS